MRNSTVLTKVCGDLKGCYTIVVVQISKSDTLQANLIVSYGQGVGGTFPWHPNGMYYQAVLSKYNRDVTDWDTFIFWPLFPNFHTNYFTYEHPR